MFKEGNPRETKEGNPRETFEELLAAQGGVTDERGSDDLHGISMFCSTRSPGSRHGQAH